MNHDCAESISLQKKRTSETRVDVGLTWLYPRDSLMEGILACDACRLLEDQKQQLQATAPGGHCRLSCWEFIPSISTTCTALLLAETPIASEMEWSNMD